MVQQIIKECLKESQQSLTYSEIVEQVQAARPGTHASTVYRNLDKMELNGDILRVGSEGRHTVYALPSLHAHNFCCTSCKDIVELDHHDIHPLEEQLKTLQSKFSDKYGAQNINHILKFVGVCKSCSRNTLPL